MRHPVETTPDFFEKSQISPWSYLFIGIMVFLSGVIVFCMCDPFPDLKILGVPVLVFLWTLMVLPLFLFCGSQKVTIKDRIVVRLGPFCVHALSIPFESVVSVKETTFRPMDFSNGRKGKVDIGRNIVGYFVNGDKGVLIETQEGKKYLIGSQRPEQLLHAIETRLDRHPT